MLFRGSTLILLLIIQEDTQMYCLGSSSTVMPSLEQNNKKLRHHSKRTLLQTRAGKYTTREEIQKAPTDDHPCRPTKTFVKITFPDMKSEVFVNFLGYKEPNLIQLLRCKGKCGLTRDEIACIPTKVRQKFVKMTVKTQLIGRDPREKFKEMVLEEHTECGCQCKHISPLTCMGMFNNLTCQCECDERHHREEILSCEAMKNTYWETSTCQCKSKSISTRGVDSYSPECAGANTYGPDNKYEQYWRQESSNSEVLSWVLLGCCLTVSIFLSATTLYYHRKVKNLLSSKQSNGRVVSGGGGGGYAEGRGGGCDGEGRGGGPGGHSKHLHNKQQKSKDRRDRYDSIPRQPSAPAPIPISKQEIEDILIMENLHQGGELYHEQYNEHGVMIEKNLSDHDLIQKYLG